MNSKRDRGEDLCVFSEDYQKYHEMQLEELELSYQDKLDQLQKRLNIEFNDIPEEKDAEDVFEENQILEEKLRNDFLLRKKNFSFLDEFSLRSIGNKSSSSNKT